MASISLATEDELSEAVGLRLAIDAGLDVDQCFRRGGSGYLRIQIAKFCEIARIRPVVVMTDLDRARCPATLIETWLNGRRRPANLLVRIAVREVESWLLADHKTMRGMLSGDRIALPQAPDSLPDPKASLLRLACRAPRAVREDLLPARGAIASQGLGYNNRLCGLVRSDWDPERASVLSPSLRRTRQRLAELAQRL